MEVNKKMQHRKTDAIQLAAKPIKSTAKSDKKRSSPEDRLDTERPFFVNADDDKGGYDSDAPGRASNDHLVVIKTGGD